MTASRAAPARTSSTGPVSYAETEEQRRQLLALALSNMPFLGPTSRLRAMRRLTASRLRSMSPAGVGELRQRATSAGQDRPLQSGSHWLGVAERSVESLTRLGVGCIFLWQPSYPRWLREVHDPPLVLYCRGRLPDPAATPVAVVGTRGPTGRGRESAFRLGYDLALAGIPVVSGLARGVDIAAHRGAVAGGQEGDRCATMGVLGCGIDQIYPQSSRELCRRLLEVGCVISEYPPGVPPLQHHFPMRNRIIAGLGAATVVVEAPARSGALITADCANAEGREVMVHADLLSSGRSAGTRALNAQGAAAVADVEQLRRHTGAALARSQPARAAAAARPTQPEPPQDWRAAGEWLVAGLRTESAAYVAGRGQ